MTLHTHPLQMSSLKFSLSLENPKALLHWYLTFNFCRMLHELANPTRSRAATRSFIILAGKVSSGSHDQPQGSRSSVRDGWTSHAQCILYSKLVQTIWQTNKRDRKHLVLLFVEKTMLKLCILHWVQIRNVTMFYDIVWKSKVGSPPYYGLKIEILCIFCVIVCTLVLCFFLVSNWH